MTTGIVIYIIPPEQMWEDLRDYYYTTKSQDLFYFPVTWSTGAILVLQIVKKKKIPHLLWNSSDDLKPLLLTG